MRLGEEIPDNKWAEATGACFDAMILKTVRHYCGVKDIDLTIMIMSELPSADATTALRVSAAIHRLIHEGFLVGVDCSMGDQDFTFVLPGGSKAMIALPVYVVENQTWH